MEQWIEKKWYIFMGLPRRTVVKNLPVNAGDTRDLGPSSMDWEDGMATHSSTLAWRTPWTEEPDALQSTGSHRIGHD